MTVGHRHIWTLVSRNFFFNKYLFTGTQLNGQVKGIFVYFNLTVDTIIFYNDIKFFSGDQTFDVDLTLLTLTRDL